MSVKVLNADRLKYADLIKNQQFFTAILNGKQVAVFPVNHRDYATATSYLSANPLNTPWDYVRTSTVEEVRDYVRLQRGA